MKNTYIVMDLEFNRPNNAFRSVRNDIRLDHEIIQIGAVKLNHDRKQLDSFCCYVRPTAYSKINGKVKELTDITTEKMWEGKPFPEAIREFLNWCGHDYEFLTWSEHDIFVLEDNMLYHNLDITDLPECYDIQLMFDDQISKSDKCMPLNYAIWKLGIQSLPAHDALNDACNTAAVFRKLDLTAGLSTYVI